MAKTIPRIKDIGQNLSAVSSPTVILSKIDAPFTTISGRAKMINLSNDFSVRMGIERIQTQQLVRVNGEIGPANEIVYKPINDKFDQIRFVGSWTSINNAAGQFCNSTGVGTDFCEISFYGTGLNILAADYDSTGRDARASINGGAEGSNFLATPLSGVLNGRNYSPNIPVSVVSGLTLGFHTVKIRNVNWLRISGFEIINSSSTLSIAPGIATSNGLAVSQSVFSSSAYNSGFESGTLGTRGGRVLVYAKQDGTIGKAVTPVDASSLTLTSTNHSNEEVIRNYFYREFGAGRSDDFSALVNGSTARAYTLDDGTTSLMSSGCQAELVSTLDTLTTNSNGQYHIFTAVCSGLDIIRQDNADGGSDTYTVSIDGGSALTFDSVGSTTQRVVKIASGLPYGTHTFKILRVSAGTFQFGVRNFITYGPKKPTLPTGAIELADYNVMANYAQISSLSGLTDINKISAGVLRKASVREFVYSGTWSYTIDVSGTTSGGLIFGNTASNYAELTFFGTAVDVRLFMNTSANSYTISIDGVTDLTGAGYTTNLVQGSTGLTFVGSTGVLSGTSAANTQVSASITNIPLGLHKLRIAFNSGNQLQIDTVDIVSPIHIHKNNGPFIIGNTLPVGSQGIGDVREFGNQLPSIAVNSRVIPLSSFSTTSTSEVVMPAMAAPIFVEEDSSVAIKFESHLNGQSAQNSPITMRIDGNKIETLLWQPSSTASNTPMVIERIVFLTKGWHFVSMGYATASGTIGSPNLASGGTEYGNVSCRVLK